MFLWLIFLRDLKLLILLYCVSVIFLFLSIGEESVNCFFLLGVFVIFFIVILNLFVVRLVDSVG